jgi:hypothetical protein
LSRSLYILKLEICNCLLSYSWTFLTHLLLLSYCMGVKSRVLVRMTILKKYIYNFYHLHTTWIEVYIS